MRDLVLFDLSSNSFDLVGYADANYVVDMVYRKKTSRMAPFFKMSAYILWSTKKKNSVAVSTTEEAEYVAVVSCHAQIL